MGEPLKLAILWHMHQPDYRAPGSDNMLMPWVRLHAIKDYLDMPLRATRYARIRTTFNLVPSLIDQLQGYLKGAIDPHLELSAIPADQLSELQRIELLNTFFSANPLNMIEPFDRYRSLHRKMKENEGQAVLPSLFTRQELTDLQVWSNLAWVDPLFRTEEPVRTLFDKQSNFTEEDKQSLLKWQIDAMSRILPTYRKLVDEGRIEVSFTPYYHPILPLLCDTEVALEATPSATLPESRFQHPEDARRQVSMAVEKYSELFDRPLRGMWPAEGSVSDEAIEILHQAGIEWIATDQEILERSLMKLGEPTPGNSVHRVFNSNSGVKMFFRDHGLSDRIGFVYSSWDADRAVEDLIRNLKRIREANKEHLDETVVSIILDGENAWEYFPDDGSDFLDLLYKSLNEDSEIETVTFGEAAGNVPARNLKTVFAGSWINHNFNIWIGHPEDNAAWDQLSLARSALVEYEKNNPDADRHVMETCWQQIYRAEGSDWCWWYGDDHRSAHNAEFDWIFRRHLLAVYEFLGLDPPGSLHQPISRTRTEREVSLPTSLVTPDIDGRLTHFYEWYGAGVYLCQAPETTMHRQVQVLHRIHFAFDHSNLYIRLDFTNKKPVELVENLKIKALFETDEEKTIEAAFDKAGCDDQLADQWRWSLQEIFELAIKRTYLWETGRGRLSFRIEIFDGDKLTESWPSGVAIDLELPDAHNEFFWPP